MTNFSTDTQLNDNFIQRFLHHSQTHPDQLALHISHMEKTQCTSQETLSYGQLADEVRGYQALWRAKGWQTNDRIIVILKPSTQLYAIVLSLLGLGMTPVFIDTGMGRAKIKMAIEDAHARAIISMNALLKWFWLIRPMWSLTRLSVDGKGLGYASLASALVNSKKHSRNQNEQCIAQPNAKHGLISFTSGSTGRPKGADRTHYSLVQQHLAIRNHWPDTPQDIDSPCFPVMVLHNLSCGMTTVMPKVDLAEPANADAAQVIEQIAQHGITRISGAPAYIQALVNYSIAHNKTNPSVTSLVVGGATVSAELAQGILNAFPQAYSRIVYGSTEAEPISSINVKDYLAHGDQSQGYLVGEPAEQVQVLIAHLPQSKMTEQTLLNHIQPIGQVGEILVSGEHVLKQYVDNPSANAENKIKRTLDSSDDTQQMSVWHRTGDSGFLDTKGQLWLTGRVKDTVQVNGQMLQPYPLEQALDCIDGVSRSALVSDGNTVCMFIETAQKNTQPLAGDVQDQVMALLVPAGLAGAVVKVIAHMPVDGRHNSKIDRVALRNSMSH